MGRSRKAANCGMKPSAGGRCVDEWRRGSAPAAALTLALLWFFPPACRKSIEISLRACFLQNDEPLEGAVLPYSKVMDKDVSARRAKTGPFITVLFSTPTDLESLGKRKEIHHLYSGVFACSSVPLENVLCGWYVYKPTAHEVERLVAPERAAGENFYKVYIPNRLSEIRKYAEVVGGLNVAAEMEKVRSAGLCMIIGGGNMLGGGSWSQPLRIPVAVVNDSLEIKKQTAGGMVTES